MISIYHKIKLHLKSVLNYYIDHILLVEYLFLRNAFERLLKVLKEFVAFLGD